MPVNKENINKMIEAIKAEAKPIFMSTFVERNTACGTSACLAGWANLIRLNEVHIGDT